MKQDNSTTLNERKYPFIPAAGDCEEHPYPPPQMTDYTFVNNDSFKGFRIGLQRICPVCAFVSHTVKGVSMEELKDYQRAEFIVEHDGTKRLIRWTAGRKNINVYETPDGNRRLCIEDAAALYDNKAMLLGPSERGEQCEICGTVSDGAGTSSKTE